MLTQEEIDDWYFDPPIPPDDVKSPDPERWPYFHGWGACAGVKGYIWSNVPYAER